jgi:uncharacterized protein YlxP (DUF503 family)
VECPFGGLKLASVIGYLELELYIPQAHSLKEKRAYVKRLVERLKKKFNVSVSEVGFLDSWQRSLIAVVTVSGDSRVVDSTLEKVVSFTQELLPGSLVSYHKELL